MFTMLLLRMFPLEMHYVKKTLTFKQWSTAMEYIDQTCAVKLTFFMYIYFSLLSQKSNIGLSKQSHMMCLCTIPVVCKYLSTEVCTFLLPF